MSLESACDGVHVRVVCQCILILLTMDQVSIQVVYQCTAIVYVTCDGVRVV